MRAHARFLQASVTAASLAIVEKNSVFYLINNNNNNGDNNNVKYNIKHGIIGSLKYRIAKEEM